MDKATRVAEFRFRPALVPTVAMLLGVALCIRLGLWQWHKAEVRQQLQAQLDARLTEPPVALPETLQEPESWRYRRVRISGHYDGRYQILLDNQVQGEVAGYHVMTPLVVEGMPIRVLVNRGWVAAPADRRQVPEVAVPQGRQEIEGQVWLPPDKGYLLQAQPAIGTDWPRVWQQLDLKRFRDAVPFSVHAAVVRMAPGQSDGLVRAWPRPAERVAMHWGYAWQWFGFAFALVAIYLVVNFRRGSRS